MPEDKSVIARWYAGRSIFVTGASGFMGKVLLEKLLYGCPDIERVYILLRGKRGRSALERIEDMWKLPMFERLRKQQPNAMKKVTPIIGDLISPALGISPEQRKLVTDNVSVVFHMAATLKLEGTLKDAVDMNVSGTHKVIELCKEMKKLAALVHLSTAFCNIDIKRMEEKVYEMKGLYRNVPANDNVYPSQHNPKEVMDMVGWMNPEALLKATPEIIAPHPNTYIYTKRLAEVLIAEQFPQMPVAVTRPSIVGPSGIEPVAGWVDNLNGPIGLLVGAGKGVIRSMKGRPDYPAHTVPVDLAINALIAIGWKTALAYAKQKPEEIPVYNMSQDPKIKVTFGEVLQKGKDLVLANPFEWQIWYPGGDLTSSDFMHWLYVIFLHFLPAYFLDFLLMIFGQKRFMVRLQWRITEGLHLLQFFTMNYWDFDCTNFHKLWEEMTEDDKKRFSIDFMLMDQSTYLKISILGARQYCVKEDLSSLPRCRIKQKFLYVLHVVTVTAIYYYLLRLVGWFIPPVSVLLDTVLGYVGSFFKIF